jgi:hypothetical protein
MQGTAVEQALHHSLCPAHIRSIVTTQKRTISSDDESYVLPSTEATQAIIDGTLPEAALL